MTEQEKSVPDRESPMVKFAQIRSSISPMLMLEVKINVADISRVEKLQQGLVCMNRAGSSFCIHSKAVYMLHFGQ